MGFEFSLTWLPGLCLPFRTFQFSIRYNPMKMNFTVGGSRFLTRPFFPVVWKPHPVSGVEGKQACVCVRRSNHRCTLEDPQKCGKKAYTFIYTLRSSKRWKVLGQHKLTNSVPDSFGWCEVLCSVITVRKKTTHETVVHRKCSGKSRARLLKEFESIHSCQVPP